MPERIIGELNRRREARKNKSNEIRHIEALEQIADGLYLLATIIQQTKTIDMFQGSGR